MPSNPNGANSQTRPSTTTEPCFATSQPTSINNRSPPSGMLESIDLPFVSGRASVNIRQARHTLSLASSFLCLSKERIALEWCLYSPLAPAMTGNVSNIPSPFYSTSHGLGADLAPRVTKPAPAAARYSTRFSARACSTVLWSDENQSCRSLSSGDHSTAPTLLHHARWF